MRTVPAISALLPIVLGKPDASRCEQTREDVVNQMARITFFIKGASKKVR